MPYITVDRLNASHLAKFGPSFFSDPSRLNVLDNDPGIIHPRPDRGLMAPSSFFDIVFSTQLLMEESNDTVMIFSKIDEREE